MRPPSGSSGAVNTLQNWQAELHRRYAPLLPGTTAIIFRLLFPDHDADRKYGMQEARLAQYLAEIIGVSTSPGGRGNALVNWNGENAVGCLGNEVQDVLEKSTSVTAYIHRIYACVLTPYPLDNGKHS